MRSNGRRPAVARLLAGAGPAGARHAGADLPGPEPGGLSRRHPGRGERRLARPHGARPPGRARGLARRAVPALGRRPSGRLGGGHRQRRQGAQGRPQGGGHRAVHRPRARGLRRLGRSGRHRLRRHLAATARSTGFPRARKRPRERSSSIPARPTSGPSPAPRTARLLVGTGTEGKLFRVDAKGKGEVLYDSDDTHIRAARSRCPAATSWSAPPARA